MKTRLGSRRLRASSSSSSTTRRPEGVRQPPRAPITRTNISELATASRHAFLDEVWSEEKSSLTKIGSPPAALIAVLAASRYAPQPSTTELTKIRGRTLTAKPFCEWLKRSPHVSRLAWPGIGLQTFYRSHVLAVLASRGVVHGRSHYRLSARGLAIAERCL